MVLVKTLKRRDASSVIVAILVAMIIINMLQTVPARWAGWLSGLHSGQYPGYAFPGTGWKGEYLYPVVFAILQLLVLEILGWIYIWASEPFRKK